MKTKCLSNEVIKDAMNVCNGYHLNAKTSIGYAFCKSHDNRSVATGEFIFRGETVTNKEFDGYIFFEDKILIDFISFEVIKLK